MLESQLSALLATLALPAVGLPALFIVCLLSATLLPMGSEPALFALVKANPELFAKIQRAVQQQDEQTLQAIFKDPEVKQQQQQLA